MIISVDGPIGSGKTTLTSLLASVMGGIDFRHTPVDRWVGAADSVMVLIEQLSMMRAELRTRFQSDSDYDESYRSRAFFLFNLYRVVLASANVKARESKHIFIDTFFDPLWVLEEEHFDEFYSVMNTMIASPDISFFLRLSEEQSIQRASMRDAAAGIVHEVDADMLKAKRRAFVGWAEKNVPNFHVLRADRPVADVLSEAMEVIKSYE